MYEAIKNSPEKVTLLGVGPLTDFALLFKQYPDVVENIAEVYIMGGNIGHGNHSPFAEYNIAGDPEAAQIVFHSGLPVYVAPLEIGDKAHLTQDQMDKIKECGEVGKMLYSMRIFNADGSEAMMCGNASRCIAKYLYEKKITDKTTIRLETLSGVKVLSLHLKAGKVESVTVDMLKPAFEVKAQFTGHVPDELQTVKELAEHVIRTEEGQPKSLFVSMGNPHYVIFVDDVEQMDITTLGKILERYT